MKVFLRVKRSKFELSSGSFYKDILKRKHKIHKKLINKNDLV